MFSVVFVCPSDPHTMKFPPPFHAGTQAPLDMFNLVHKRAVAIRLKCLLITTRKQSLGQGNIFRSVCQEFCSQGGGVPGQVPPWDQVHPTRTRCTPQDQIHPLGAVHAGRYGQQAGGTHPTGMHSCLVMYSV